MVFIQVTCFRCTPGNKYGVNCTTSCDALLDEDLTDDIRCLEASEKVPVTETDECEVKETEWYEKIKKNCPGVLPL